MLLHFVHYPLPALALCGHIGPPNFVCFNFKFHFQFHLMLSFLPSLPIIPLKSACRDGRVGTGQRKVRLPPSSRLRRAAKMQRPSLALPVLCFDTVDWVTGRPSGPKKRLVLKPLLILLWWIG